MKTQTESKLGVNLSSMCEWESSKAIFLLSIADKLGMDIGGYGQLSVNPNSGYTYLWLDDYAFTLYMPINCDLVKTDICALWTDPNDGEEFEMSLKGSTNLYEIETWANECERGNV